MRLLLLEDEADLAIAIQKTLRSHHYVVDWVSDGGVAWESLQMGDLYQMAILDWMVPGLSGLEICQRLRQQENPIPVLMLTARDRMDDRVSGLDAGADDYLVKPFGMEELLARIRVLLRRAAASVPAPTVVVGSLEFDLAAREAKVKGVTVFLPRRELAVLDALARRAGRVVMREHLETQVYGFDDEIASNALEAHISRLRKRLSEAGACVILDGVRGVGYMLRAA